MFWRRVGGLDLAGLVVSLYDSTLTFLFLSAHVESKNCEKLGNIPAEQRQSSLQSD